MTSRLPGLTGAALSTYLSTHIYGLAFRFSNLVSTSASTVFVSNVTTEADKA